MFINAALVSGRLYLNCFSTKRYDLRELILAMKSTIDELELRHE